MDETGSAWLDAEMFEKHNSSIPPEFAHLLGDASGPQKKAAKKSTQPINGFAIYICTITHPSG